jgi:hypothetical protein
MANPIWKNMAKFFASKPKKAPEYTFSSFQKKMDAAADPETPKLLERKSKLEGKVAEAEAQIKAWKQEIASIKPWVEMPK